MGISIDGGEEEVMGCGHVLSKLRYGCTTCEADRLIERSALLATIEALRAQLASAREECAKVAAKAGCSIRGGCPCAADAARAIRATLREIEAIK